MSRSLGNAGVKKVSVRSTAGPELVHGVGRRDRERHLFHGRHFARVGAHEAVGLAVDAGEAGDGLARAGPMGCVMSVSLSAADQTLKYGSWAMSGTAGGRCWPTARLHRAENRGCREPLKTRARRHAGRAKSTLHHFVTLLELDGFQISNFIMCVRFRPESEWTMAISDGTGASRACRRIDLQTRSTLPDQRHQGWQNRHESASNRYADFQRHSRAGVSGHRSQQAAQLSDHVRNCVGRGFAAGAGGAG